MPSHLNTSLSVTSTCEKTGNQFTVTAENVWFYYYEESTDEPALEVGFNCPECGGVEYFVHSLNEES